MALKTVITFANVDFDYEAMKTKYTGSVNRFLQTQDSSQLTPYTREWVNETMLKVKKHRSMESTTICHPVSINGSLFDVLTINGVEKLVCCKDNKVLEVLDSEESFNVFMDFHLRDEHCRGKGFYRMYSVLNNFYDFANNFLVYFMKSCDVCLRALNNKIKESNNIIDENVKKNGFNSLVHIIFMDMSSCIATAHEYKYLLVHRETDSGYVLLRPLTELDAAEAASELYKIFVDFGPPETVQTTDKNFLEDVMELLKKSPIKYNTLVSETFLECDDFKYKIINYINKWMECSNCTDWPLTCYAVQFCMNTEGDAMEKVFGKRVPQSAKKRLSKEKTDASEVPPARFTTTDQESRDSESSVSCDEDMSRTENIISVDHASTSMAVDSTESKNLLDYGSASTTEPSVEADKPERLKCVVCDRVFMFTIIVHTCYKCKKFVHFYCGRRKAADPDIADIEFICNNCSQFETVDNVI